jgi:ADP-heptose:LPS heptosyltransferase
MIKIYFTKFVNIYRFMIFMIIDFVISFKSFETNTDTLLLIRLDAIGDYILVRNFIQHIKQSKKYKDYRITLCGNVVWKDLAETFDKNIIENFIWVDRKKFNNNSYYKYKLLKDIHQSGFEVVIDTTFSREILYSDSIVKISKAIERIGSTGAQDSYVKWKRNLLTDKYYTKLITQSEQNLFEFYRNKEFFANVLQEKINIVKPEIDSSALKIQLPTKNDFAVVFPGAQEAKRRWSSSNFEIIIEHLIAKYNINVIIAGSSADSVISRKMVKCHISKACFDLTGKTTLPQLAKLISLSKILITNETSAVHFAAAVNTPFICISNGQRFGRFMPYPSETNVIGKYVYPIEIENNLNNIDYLTKKFQFDSDLDINAIKVERVLAALDETINIMLSEQ